MNQRRSFEQRYNLNMVSRAFENGAPRLYNKLPNYIKFCQTRRSFKEKVQDLFIYGILRPEHRPSLPLLIKFEGDSSEVLTMERSFEQVTSDIIQSATLHIGQGNPR
ncbi:uncharacterized protein LOC143027532 isoform X2 [Oratosquilla oratoria]|uniref:uncharacterized protein LOC143027532 isoform X2 n=1 Tax=Oratosquilla oratoria TaxID=337810 RepID=UPI003F760727